MLEVITLVFVDLFVLIFNVLLLIRVVMSWLVPSPGVFGRLIFDLTEPVLVPVRRLLPSGGLIDLSPLVTFFLLQILQLGLHALIGAGR